MELSPVVLEPGKALAARGMASLPSLLGALLMPVLHRILPKFDSARTRRNPH